jgi:hypothetical protein
MNHDLYRFRFGPEVSMEEIETTMLLALLAAEALHGEAQVRLDAGHYLDTAQRACVIDGGTEVGRDLNRLFVGFLRREFGADAFQVERVRAESRPQVQVAAAGP